MKQQLTPLATTVAAPLVRKWIDIPLGIALFRSRTIPMRFKLGALLLGVAAMFLVQVLEIPLEALTVIFASPVGLEDDLEAVFWTFTFACSLLPHVAPTTLVRELTTK